MKRAENMEAIASTAGNFKASADAERENIAGPVEPDGLNPDEDARCIAERIWSGSGIPVFHEEAGQGQSLQ